MRQIGSAFLILVSFFVMAQDGPAYEVTITNLTKGQVFSAPVVITHSRGYALFTLGAAASDELALMAEDGAGRPLADAALENASVYDAVVADGPVRPGTSATVVVNAGTYGSRVSVAGMLVITNDTFFALNGVQGPPGLVFKNGLDTQVYMAEAYDAGSENNTEACSDIPGPPCGNNGVRVTDGAEGYVYISSGISGEGDLSASRYDWRSAVARVTIRLVR